MHASIAATSKKAKVPRSTSWSCTPWWRTATTVRPGGELQLRQHERRDDPRQARSRHTRHCTLTETATRCRPHVGESKEEYPLMRSSERAAANFRSPRRDTRRPTPLSKQETTVERQEATNVHPQCSPIGRAN